MAHIQGGFEWVSQDERHYGEQLAFAAHRIEEGLGLLKFFAAFLDADPHARVLDVGAGNGGAILPFANAGYDACAFDIVPNRDLLALRSELALPLQSVVGMGPLPFASASFSVVLLLDVIEHVGARHELGAEIMRILKPGGRCMVTTPARVRYLFRRDPHFGVPLILFLPNAVQRFVVNNIARRTVIGTDGKGYPAYDVEHIFWHVDEIAKLFPGPKSVDVLFDKYLNPSRFPKKDWFEYRYRNFLWDRVVITKEA
jgi:SAM-dependent methyltransferase